MPTDEKNDKVIMWMDRRIEDLDREELLEVVRFLASENQELRKQVDRWRAAGDPLKYLLQA